MFVRMFPAAVCVVAALWLAAMPWASATVTGPFVWSGAVWCPDHNGRPGCNLAQPSKEPAGVWYDPRGVNVGETVTFTIRNDPRVIGGHLYRWSSGAVNTGGEQTFGRGWFGWRAWLPCSGGKIADWPALWLAGVVGPWPAHGEIDIVEGLHGRAKWTYHYLNALGDPAAIGRVVPGSWCGWHRFGVWRGDRRISWWFDGRRVGLVTSAMTGVPLAGDPMRVIANLNGCVPGSVDCPAGPLVVGSRMRLARFRYKP